MSEATDRQGSDGHGGVGRCSSLTHTGAADPHRNRVGHQRRNIEISCLTVESERMRQHSWAMYFVVITSATALLGDH